MQQNRRNKIDATNLAQQNRRNKIDATKSTQQNRRNKIGATKSAQQNRRNKIGAGQNRRRPKSAHKKMNQLCCIRLDKKKIYTPRHLDA